ncbi:MAG: cytidylate kinase-like family protein [Oscillospiraceae bacterium]|nr:cytidylate kinase-like family protein [Oscillospiraceae bacterium]MCD8192596.1 cytidylate kinase-like family protein [Oscillospiraceae bacterium]
MKQFVITINRQFASLGRTIAVGLAEKLGVPFYDRDVVEQTAKSMGLPISYISEKEEASGSVYFRRQYPLGMGVPSLLDEIYAVQQNIILDFAKKGSCIIVGRNAEHILRDAPNHMSVFVYAPYAARLANCTEELGLDEEEAKHLIHTVDRARELYRRRYAPEEKSDFDGRDIMLDSSRVGVDGAITILEAATRHMFADENE